VYNGFLRLKENSKFQNYTEYHKLRNSFYINYVYAFIFSILLHNRNIPWLAGIQMIVHHDVSTLQSSCYIWTYSVFFHNNIFETFSSINKRRKRKGTYRFIYLFLSIYWFVYLFYFSLHFSKYDTNLYLLKYNIILAHRFVCYHQEYAFFTQVKRQKKWL
jgi:hypothetical protein